MPRSRPLLLGLSACLGLLPLSWLGAQPGPSPTPIAAPPVVAPPPKEPSGCPAQGQSPPGLAADYKRAGDAFAVAARLYPNAVGERARASSSETLAARAAHQRGAWAEAQKLAQPGLPDGPQWAQADHDYTRARIFESCGMRRAALRQYREIVWTPYALPGTVSLAREGLRRLGHPDLVPALASEGSPDPAEAKRAYRAALAEGRSLAEKGQLAAAYAALCNAVSYAVKSGALSGVDSSSLSGPVYAELGLLAYGQRALDDAEDFTRAAIQREWFSQSPGGVAGALYNLGLILEEKGDKLGAIEAYQASLQRRGNATVRARLVALWPGADQPLVAPRALLGPFASLAEYCQRSARSACSMDTTPDETTYECRPSLVDSLRGVTLPYRQVGLLKTGCLFDPSQGRGNHHYRLVIQTAAGVFVSSVIATRWQNRRCDSQVQVRELALRDLVPGGAKEIVLRLQHRSSCVGKGEDLKEEAGEILALAGLGPSGQPSATAAIPLRVSEEDTEAERQPRRQTRQHSASVTFLPDGKLRLVAGPSGAPAELSGLLGEHPLHFL